LISILCAILACIALIELILHKGTKDAASNTKNKARTAEIVPRQDGGSVSLCTEYATQTATVTTTIYSSDGVIRRSFGERRRQESLATATPTTNDSTDLPAAATSSLSITSLTATAIAYGSLDAATTCESTTTFVTTVTLVSTLYGSLTSQSVTESYTSDFGSLEPTSTAYASTYAGAYGSLKFTTTSSAYGSLAAPLPTTTTTAYPSLTEISASTAYPSLTETSIATAYPSLVSSTTAMAYPSLASTTSRKSTTTPKAYSPVTIAPAIESSTSYPSLTSQYPNVPSTEQYGTVVSAFPSLNTEPSTSQYSTASPISLTTISLSGTIIVIPVLSSNTPESASVPLVITEHVYSTSYVAHTSSSFSVSTPGKTSASSSSISASPTNAADTLTQSEIQIGDHFTNIDYFNAMYLPTLLAVMLKSIWVVVFASTKMMEPFHQLSKAKGATAEDTLFQNHWVMALTTGIYVILAFVPPLASESMTVKFLSECSKPGGRTFKCGPAWMVDVSAIRGVEILLGMMAAMVLVLVVLQWDRKNGVMSDPSSIASMASFLHHPEVLADFRGIDTMANPIELWTLLAGNQYMLATYESDPGQYRYGLVKTVGTIRIGGSGANSNARYQPLSNPSNSETKITTRSIPWGAIRDGMLILCLLGLLGICIGYYLDGKSDPFNNYFNSDGFGPRFILVIVATIVDYQWKRIEREVRIMDPFRRLGKRMALPRKTILASRRGTPFDALPIALWNMNFFVAAIAAVAILSDILIIAILGVPFSSAEIKPASLASFYVSFGILGIMLIAFVAVTIWRRSNPPIPRQPDTLASVWTYLCASNMLEDFEGMEFMTEKVRNKTIRDAGRRYFYGMANGTDGKDRYMVDHEGAGGTVFY
jgi:uncharacterized membrane protein YhaH (DUF805 family)